MRLVSLFAALFIFPSVFANEKGQPLLFPAPLNNIQVLPQKFEYSLRDAYRLLLGSRIIDTSAFQFQIIPGERSMQVQIRWPENLFDHGTVSILNPSGVSVWSAPLPEKQNSITLNDSSSFITRLMGLSFFRFCVSQYELSTGMEVCSHEIIIKGAGNKIRAENRNQPRKPYVQINGRAVTPHGIVFLNDEKESLSFRAISASGTEFKMDTRSINLEFVDVLSLNDALMSITVKGPYPLAPSSYKILKDGLWSVTLKKDRALIYVAGEGKVPLRQEFVVQGALPVEQNRLYLDRSSPTRAYASSLELRGTVPQKGLPAAAEAGTDLAVLGNRFTWTLNNLAEGRDRMSKIHVVDGQDTFTAGYTFQREFARRFETLLGFNSEDTVFYGGAEAQLWFESVPLLTQLTQQRLGLGLIYSQELTGDVKAMLLELDLHIRLKKGLQFFDSSPVVGLGVQHLTFDSNSLQTFAPFVGWVGPGFKKLPYFDWFEAHIRHSMPANKGDLKLKARTELKTKFYHSLKNDKKIRYSAGVYTEDAGKKRSGALLEAAYVWVF